MDVTMFGDRISVDNEKVMIDGEAWELSVLSNDVPLITQKVYAGDTFSGTSYLEVDGTKLIYYFQPPQVGNSYSSVSTREVGLISGEGTLLATSLKTSDLIDTDGKYKDPVYTYTDNSYGSLTYGDSSLTNPKLLENLHEYTKATHFLQYAGFDTSKLQSQVLTSADINDPNVNLNVYDGASSILKFKNTQSSRPSYSFETSSGATVIVTLDGDSATFDSWDGADFEYKKTVSEEIRIIEDKPQKVVVEEYKDASGKVLARFEDDRIKGSNSVTIHAMDGWLSKDQLEISGLRTDGKYVYDSNGNPETDSDGKKIKLNDDQKAEYDKAIAELSAGSHQKYLDDKATRDENLGLTKDRFGQTAGFIFDRVGQFLAGAREYTGFTSLIMGDDEYAKLVEEIKQDYGKLWFEETIVSEICSEVDTLALAAQGYGVLTDGGSTSLAASIQARKSHTYTSNNETLHLYKISYHVFNPENDDLGFDIKLDSAQLYNQPQNVGPGQSKTVSSTDQITFYSKNSYSRICLKFTRSVPDISDTICNRVVDESNEATPFSYDVDTGSSSESTTSTVQGSNNPDGINPNI
jgi:hypothetical protein